MIYPTWILYCIIPSSPLSHFYLLVCMNLTILFFSNHCPLTFFYFCRSFVVLILVSNVTFIHIKQVQLKKYERIPYKLDSSLNEVDAREPQHLIRRSDLHMWVIKMYDFVSEKKIPNVGCMNLWLDRIVFPIISLHFCMVSIVSKVCHVTRATNKTISPQLAKKKSRKHFVSLKPQYHPGACKYDLKKYMIVLFQKLGFLAIHICTLDHVYRSLQKQKLANLRHFITGIAIDIMTGIIICTLHSLCVQYYALNMLCFPFVLSGLVNLYTSYSNSVWPLFCFSIGVLCSKKKCTQCICKWRKRKVTGPVNSKSKTIKMNDCKQTPRMIFFLLKKRERKRKMSCPPKKDHFNKIRIPIIKEFARLSWRKKGYIGWDATREEIRKRERKIGSASEREGARSGG
ncbi:hypothetical protein VP01_1447g3 [Puccinia sorghi]|uniref:Uncharacterized protein n=1 Tax=Puccinia sorghi TaxID=27349 RepID=A0A0L6VLZ2_9BASI|nr:hypothetical protein VP01_1447g3 [Puccinia sorghi]